jgi:hypothetical protein
MKTWTFSLCLLPALLAFRASGATNPNVDFDRQVRPILSDNCFTCHGPDEKRRMAGLHFDTKDGALGKPGVIVPGDSAHSRMYLRITNPKEAMRMPPTYSGHKLTAAQIELIRKWIDAGAKWESHWAYIAPKRPEIPTVSNEKWAKTPIDRFVLAKLDSEGLHPAPEADKRILLRRVTFDLTGLPPTPAELKAFLGDSSPNAYEKVVDRLLASPHYGERMAMQWLDFARYSDTHGYHIDSAREMWPWRDWVIGAFNRNMPYDQFTVEQLAGDLLPHATQSQLIATGFNRNHMINFEGGAIPEEYQNEYIVDRIEATSTTWLGTTLGCARCHDHKYDPLSQKDFYSFGAFFNAVPEEGLDGYKGNAKPYLQLPSDEQSDIKRRLQDAIWAKDQEIAAAQKKWEEQQRQVQTSDVVNGLTADYSLRDSLNDRIDTTRAARVIAGKFGYGDGRMGRAAQFDGDTQVNFGDTLRLQPGKPWSISMWVKPDGPSGMSVIQQFASPKTRGAGVEVATDYCAKSSCNVIVRLAGAEPTSLLEVKSSQGLRFESWNHLIVAYDGSEKAAGVQIYVDGKLVKVTTPGDSFKAVRFDGTVQIGNKNWGTPFKGSLSDLRYYDRGVTEEEAANLGKAFPLHLVLQLPDSQRTEEQSDWLRKSFFQTASKADKQLDVDYQSLTKGLAQLNREIPSTMVMSEMRTPRQTHVLKRGDYQSPGDLVQPSTPSVLPAMPKDAPRNRLTLARWLINPTNPLTARVAVNHFWQMYFGLGIVKTSEDFGSQGDPPSNQALLDWLATEFIRTGWDVKSMQRVIVTSAAYRQESSVTPELLERDPENRLLARGPRFRLPAEMVRDNALAISGLLRFDVGGRSVFPYQPKGLWEEMAFGGDFSAQTYVQSHGSDLYRRSMYTFWKRSVPYPTLNTFDAPDREKCTARRSVTNTPLQALVVLNDPTYVEAARVFAERDLREAGPNRLDRIRFAFRLATDRDPTAQESAVLEKLYRKEMIHYDSDRAAATKLVSVGESKRDPKLDPAELAAWTLVTSTILNMDETMTKN